MPGGSIILDVKHCARCHDDHNGQEFSELDYSIPDPEGDYNYWSLCPTSMQPILARVSASTN